MACVWRMPATGALLGMTPAAAPGAVVAGSGKNGHRSSRLAIEAPDRAPCRIRSARFIMHLCFPIKRQQAGACASMSARNTGAINGN